LHLSPNLPSTILTVISIDVPMIQTIPAFKPLEFLSRISSLVIFR
jgi:hypothetical protein